MLDNKILLDSVFFFFSKKKTPRIGGLAVEISFVED